jgi:hypothetical protein
MRAEKRLEQPRALRAEAGVLRRFLLKVADGPNLPRCVEVDAPGIDASPVVLRAGFADDPTEG